MTKRKSRKWESPYRGAAVVSLIAVCAVVFIALFAQYGSYYKRSSRVKEGITEAVPDSYLTECDHPGTVIRMDYPTKDYLSGREIYKPAFIYLPYGYDETSGEPYDVMYMMHGWMMQAQDYLTDDAHIRDLFDHLIDRGDTKPFIAVCLTFDAQNEPATYEKSVDELANFQEELRNDVIPYIEARLHTYAKNTSIKELRATRDHRIFAGFSMGAVTAWHQFIFNLDIIHKFVIMSGDCWITGQNGGLLRPEKTVSRLVSAIHDRLYHLEDYFLYVGVGDIDPMHDQVDSQVQEMMRRQEFCAENMIYEIKENGYHDMNAVREYLYNALPKMLSKEE